MNKISGSILILAGAVSGHGALVFLASHPQIHRYDIPANVANVVMTAIVAAGICGLWGILHLFKRDAQ